jgi:hypothetical protein
MMAGREPFNFVVRDLGKGERMPDALAIVSFSYP